MKTFFLISLIGLSAISWAPGHPDQSSTNHILVDTIYMDLEFIPKEKAAKLLRLEDAMSNIWNKFDITARLKGKEGDKNDLLEFISQQARDWTPEEIAFLRKSRDTINAVIHNRGLIIDFPEKIPMLKTTMNEESGAGGYTRDNYIVLIDKIKTAPQDVATLLLAHETFHILTRNDPEFRKKMYSVIGFTILPHEVEFPQELRDRIITNPDVIRHDSYATFTINGKKTDCVMVTYTKEPYNGNQVMKYVNTGLVPIDKESGKVIEKDGKAVLYPITDAKDFYDKVGKNTYYTFDPEEILAENFSLLLTNQLAVNDPEIIWAMEKICK